MTTTPAERIGGWLIMPLAWLLVALLSASLTLFLLVARLFTPSFISTLSAQGHQGLLLWCASLLTTVAMWSYTLWLVIAFFKRRRCVPRHYIIWLLISVLLALKSFAFSPVIDGVAVQQLLFTLLAAALMAPGFRRSARVKSTFVNP
ncbi:DUF2569 domain-containing protein [Intestinirhabdus alba]|jgi:hypothetical protein|uniref:DUF2569 family protein n=1 Tax=Intestinirhabdus alba TaxID=2899544 RepID=A0A6L6IQM2_9ENTR|nr:DUF2569 domain-containing protein [Intestinirhabdus alba]MTH48254.1 DUF2569 family protein [Intestinirhabdus alba]